MSTSLKSAVYLASLVLALATATQAPAQQPTIIYSSPTYPQPINGQPIYTETIVNPPVYQPIEQPVSTATVAPIVTPFVGLGETLPTESISMEEYCRSELSQFQSFPFEFEVQTINGHTLTKESFEGQVLVAVMWASWCAPCRLEIPHLVELQNRYGARGMSILGMANEGGSDVQQMITTIQNVQLTDGINYLLALGSDEINQQVPSFGGFPTMLILDQQGNVRMTMTGYQPIEKLEKFVTLLLNEQAVAKSKKAPADPATKLTGIKK